MAIRETATASGASAKRTARKRPAATARKRVAEPACPDDLSLPRPSREDYAGTVEEQLADFEETLAGLEEDLESGSWDEVGDYHTWIEGLRSQLDEIRARAGEIEAVEDKAWPSVHEDMEKTLLEMSDSIKEISTELGRVLPE